MLSRLLSDIRLAVRVLGRTPSFALIATGVLALGIGANTAIFSLVRSVLLRPLPFEEPERLVRLFQTPPPSAFPGIESFPLSPANFYDWQGTATRFEDMALYRFLELATTSHGEGVSVPAAAVTPGFFSVLRGRPALGRVFLDEEDEPGRSRVVILSHGFWQGRLGGRTDVVGQSLVLNDEPYTIVGVMPARFSVRAFGPTARDLWVPLALSSEQRANRENHNRAAVARLAPGATVAEAQAELDVISRRLAEAHPTANAGWGALVVPMREAVVGDVRLSLWMLLGAVALVLFIACANVGNLLLARTLARRKELAIRAAVGASRGRIFQQLLVESVVLAVSGGLAGLLLAHMALGAARRTLANQLPRADELSIDPSVLLFLSGVTLLTGVLAGAIPALRAGGAELQSALREGGRNDVGAGLRARRALVVGELALSVVLLMGAGVMVRSLRAIDAVDTGFQAEGVLTLRVALSERRYVTPGSARAFFDAALQGLRTLPGAVAAGGIDDLPTQDGSVQPIVPEGRPELPPRDQPTVDVRRITPGYFETLRIPLLRGRDVHASDTEVVLVSHAAAKLLWGDADPVGRRVMLPLLSRARYKTVIGVVGDVKQGALTEPANPTVYQYSSDNSWRSFTLALRSSVPATTLMPAAFEVIRRIDPLQPVDDVRTLQAIVDDTLVARRLNAWLLSLFASIAVGLAAVGLYSVLAYVVRGRRREIGIRTALGAQAADVLRLFVLEGMKPAFVGIAIGAAAALASATLLERFVFGVSASDPIVLTLVAALLGLVAFVATLVPAWRASRVAPLTALRDS